MIRADIDKLDELYQIIARLASVMEECWYRLRTTADEMAAEEIFLAIPEAESLKEHLQRAVESAAMAKELLLSLRNILPTVSQEYKDLEETYAGCIENIGELFEGLVENTNAALAVNALMAAGGAARLEEMENPETLLFQTECMTDAEELAAVTEILEASYCYSEVENEKQD